MDQIAAEQDRFKQLEPSERLVYALEAAKQLGLAPPDMELDQARRLFYVFKSNVRALDQYVPHRYPGALTLFRASEPFGDQMLAEDLGWGRLAGGGLSVHWVEGNHYTLVREPYVAGWAQQLNDCLRQAVAEWSLP